MYQLHSTYLLSHHNIINKVIICTELHEHCVPIVLFDVKTDMRRQKLSQTLHKLLRLHSLFDKI